MWPIIIIAAVAGVVVWFSQHGGEPPAPERVPEPPVHPKPEPTKPPAAPKRTPPPETMAPTPPKPEPAPAAPPKLTLVPAALPTPMYPAGLQAKLGKVTVTLTKAWLDGQGGAHYEVDIKGTPLGLYDTTGKAVSEKYLRDTLAKQVKQPLAGDQVFPVGIEVYRGGQGGVIETAEQHNGEWTYRIKGWSTPTPQAQLLSILRR